ncbi:MAG TPA: hypothetical protein VN366_04310 [Feifaniaceae bacterium]|nr:hypothetical protein [Feifaniaceae bacterium]
MTPEKQTEAALRSLMDFGRFCKNERLGRMAAEALARYPANGMRELMDDELGALFAAGESAWGSEDDDDVR